MTGHSYRTDEARLNWGMREIQNPRGVFNGLVDFSQPAALMAGVNEVAVAMGSTLTRGALDVLRSVECDEPEGLDRPSLRLSFPSSKFHRPRFWHT
jgi:hypothetical protein